MAVVTATRYARATGGRRDTDITQYYAISASGTAITTSSLGDTRPRKLVSVTIHYSAAASTAVLITVNYVGLTTAAGASATTYDTTLTNPTLSAATDYVYQPTGEFILSGLDTVTVTATPAASNTAAIVITTEVL